MKKGALLFAFNSPSTDYFKMAVATAKRINHFLDLPVSVVTDMNTDVDSYQYKFDNVYIQEADTSNIKEKNVWINKGRYRAYELTPYDETLVIDTDYMVNSNLLSSTFIMGDDFVCPKTTSFLMFPNGREQEMISSKSFPTLWATVMRFNKSSRSKQLFECMGMIQQNYNHYANIYGFVGGLYRNDYSLTIANRIVNGHLEQHSDYLPWNLVHIGQNTTVYRDSNDEFNTQYTVIYDNWMRGKIKKEYLTIKDMDFHMLNKKNYMELI